MLRLAHPITMLILRDTRVFPKYRKYLRNLKISAYTPINEPALFGVIFGTIPVVYCFTGFVEFWIIRCHDSFLSCWNDNNWCWSFDDLVQCERCDWHRLNRVRTAKPGLEIKHTDECGTRRIIAWIQPFIIHTAKYNFLQVVHFNYISS